MARNRRRARVEEASGNDRWVVSYADFITLLFAFFTAMYAISSVNEGKYKSVSESLARAFNPSESAPAKIIEETEFVEVRGESISDAFKSAFSTDYKEIISAVEQIETTKKIAVIYEKNRVTVRVPDGVLFASGTGELMDSGLEFLDELGRALKRIPNSVRIEGHTDNIPIKTDRYPSNWELSSTRALNILKYFVSSHGLEPRRLSATGFGEFRPLGSNNSQSGRSKNRRVDFQILARGQES
ncbi:MAG: OmpA family protein [Proteobacteria bacterium]|nr:OmpA family protein [Pseudomonadota bacterium]